jgi:hypothetical protein
MGENYSWDKLDWLTYLVFGLIGVLIVLSIVACILKKVETSSTIINENYLDNRNVFVGNNSLMAISTHKYPITRTYGSIIECMEKIESSGNPNAINPKDPITRSVGILQFKDATFEEFCIEKYKIAYDLDEIWNPEIQRDCTELMLKDGYGYHWTSNKYCD